MPEAKNFNSRKSFLGILTVLVFFDLRSLTVIERESCPTRKFRMSDMRKPVEIAIAEIRRSRVGSRDSNIRPCFRLIDFGRLIVPPLLKKRLVRMVMRVYSVARCNSV